MIILVKLLKSLPDQKQLAKNLLTRRYSFLLKGHIMQLNNWTKFTINPLIKNRQNM